MITARNYAAQLERCLELNQVLYIDDVLKKPLSTIIKTGVHFALPDDGIIEKSYSIL